MILKRRTKRREQYCGEREGWPVKRIPIWTYFLPILHFCACLMSTLRFFVPGLQYLSVMWDFVVHVDLPVSLVSEAFGPHYSALAAVWIVVAGTFWWYLLSRAAELIVTNLKRNRTSA